MATIRMKLYLDRINDGAFDNYTQDKVNRIEGNLKFASAQGTIASLKPVLAAYVDLQNLQERTRAETAKKKKLRAQLMTLLTTVATLCKLEAAGDVAYFLQSGFAVSTKSTSEQPLKPQQFSAKIGYSPGEIMVSVEPHRKATIFSFAWTADPLTSGSVWNISPSPSRKYTFKGLPGMTKIWVKGGVMNSDGRIAYSDPISRVVQ
jgi:hypothetical protein